MLTIRKKDLFPSSVLVFCEKLSKLNTLNMPQLMSYIIQRNRKICEIRNRKKGRGKKRRNQMIKVSQS